MTVLLAVLISMLSGCANQQTLIEQENPFEAGQMVDSSTEESGEELESDPVFFLTESVAELRDLEIVEFAVLNGAWLYDVVPVFDGTVWYTVQRQGVLGWLDPNTGDTVQIPLGSGSAPHGVIVGLDGAPWITDSGLNAIVRVDPETEQIKVFSLSSNFPNSNLNTVVFDDAGVLWFIGQNGVYGRLDPAGGLVQAFAVSRGWGFYGITATFDGIIFYASLAGSHIVRIDSIIYEAIVIEFLTLGQGVRRVWSDSLGRIWVSEWDAG